MDQCKVALKLEFSWICRLRREYLNKSSSVFDWVGYRGLAHKLILKETLPPVLSLWNLILSLQFRLWWALEKDSRRSPPQETSEGETVALRYFSVLTWSPDQPSIYFLLFFFFHFSFSVFLLMLLIHFFYILLLGSLSFSPFWLRFLESILCAKHCTTFWGTESYKRQVLWPQGDSLGEMLSPLILTEPWEVRIIFPFTKEETGSQKG